MILLITIGNFYYQRV